MCADDFDYVPFYIARHIKKNKLSWRTVISAGRKYIEYYRNPETNNIGADDEKEIIDWLAKYETPPELVFASLKEAMKQQ